MIQSPLNYTGGKYKLLPQLLPLIPEKIETFVDLFCGGCNVGINVAANRYIYNDTCEPLIQLYAVMQKMDTQEFLERIEDGIALYGLSDVKTKGYGYYQCDSNDGLSSYNKEPYLRLREDWNGMVCKNDEYYIKLYLLILYSFNNQIRFNRQGKFNLPVGKRDFNQRMYQKLYAFLERLHTQKAIFLNQDFADFDWSCFGEKDFVYLDPPYLITCASYNEQGGWSEQKEQQLLQLLEALTKKQIRFALSNVLESKGKSNEILLAWIKHHPECSVIELDYSYRNANYQRKEKESRTKEVLITNYFV